MSKYCGVTYTDNQVTGYDGTTPNIFIHDTVNNHAITSIDDNVFSGNPEIVSAVIGSGITVIQTGLFENCESLTFVVVSENVVAIGVSAFSGCSALTSFVMSNSITTFVDYLAFDKTPLLTKFVMSRTVRGVTRTYTTTFDGADYPTKADRINETIENDYSNWTMGRSANICVGASTKIRCDRGCIQIDKLTNRDTIRGNKIIVVTRMINPDPTVVVINEGAIFRRSPTEALTVTMSHNIMYKGRLVPARALVGLSGIREVPRACTDIMYSIRMSKMHKVVANGLWVETPGP